MKSWIPWCKMWNLLPHSEHGFVDLEICEEMRYWSHIWNTGSWGAHLWHFDTGPSCRCSKTHVGYHVDMNPFLLICKYPILVTCGPGGRCGSWLIYLRRYQFNWASSSRNWFHNNSQKSRWRAKCQSRSLKYANFRKMQYITLENNAENSAFLFNPRWAYTHLNCSKFRKHGL